MSSSTILTISSIAIRQDAAGRFCLNDLHRAAGGEKRHQPSDWLRLAQTKELVAEIENSGNSRSKATATQQGRGGGTYACREPVYSYAMWISAKFHLHVIRAYDAMVDAARAQAAGTVEAFNRVYQQHLSDKRHVSRCARDMRRWQDVKPQQMERLAELDPQLKFAFPALIGSMQA